MQLPLFPRRAAALNSRSTHWLKVSVCPRKKSKMLTALEVKPFLVHEDRPVRAAAVDYFKRSWSEDPDLVPLMLRAYRQYGPEECAHAIACCWQFALTLQSIDEVLDCLAAAKDVRTVFHLNRAIANAPMDVLWAKEAAVLDTAHLGQETAGTIKQRLEFSQWSPDKLWAELYDYARRSEGKQYVNDIDHKYADNLITALAPFDVPNTDTLCELLAAEKTEFRWLEIFLIALAGERRVPATIPSLVSRYRIDTDFLLECVTDSLARIGDPEAVRLVRAAFPNESRGFRNFSSAVLADIKHQESEDALLALLESEPDASIRTMLCVGLCKLFSKAGVGVVRREIARGYDRNVDILEDTLLPVAHVLGEVLPEADRWRAEREERQRRQAERKAELDELGRRYQAAKAAGFDPLARLQPKAKIARKPPSGESATMRREPERVGRNAPCPCGSGKKYKKCCGRNVT
jgi:hypothetical protein